MVRERLDEEAIKSPFTSLLTENVINVSNTFIEYIEKVKLLHIADVQSIIDTNSSVNTTEHIYYFYCQFKVLTDNTLKKD